FDPPRRAWYQRTPVGGPGQRGEPSLGAQAPSAKREAPAAQPGAEDSSPPPGARGTHGGRVARPGRRRADAGAGLARDRQGGHQGRAAPQQRGPQDLPPRARGGRARYDLAISSSAASKQASSSRALLSSRSSRRSTRSARSKSAARPPPRLLSTSQRGMPSRSASWGGVNPCSTRSAKWSAWGMLAAR